MTKPVDTEAIRTRLAAATPGPWGRGDRWNVQGASHCTCAPRYGPLIHEGRMNINGTMMQAHVHQAESPWHPYGIYGAPSATSRWHPVAVVIETDEYGLMDDADADLIAHAPEDLAALVAEVERLRAVADLRTQLAALRDEWRLRPGADYLHDHADALDALLREGE